MKTIDLDEILKSKIIIAISANSPDITYNATIEAMREACKQTLELAAENAVKDYPHDIKHEIKMNVINTINQIK